MLLGISASRGTVLRLDITMFASHRHLGQYRCSITTDFYRQLSNRCFPAVLGLFLIIFLGYRDEPWRLGWVLPREIAETPGRVFVLAFLLSIVLLGSFLILHHLC